MIATPKVARVRRGLPADLPTLTGMVEKYYEFDGIQFLNSRVKDALLPLLESESVGVIWLAEIDGSPVGYAALTYGYSIEFGGREATVDELFVSSTYRGAGVGTALLNALLAYARAEGVVGVSAEVERTNLRAQKFYQRHGFSVRDQYLWATQVF